MLFIWTSNPFASAPVLRRMLFVHLSKRNRPWCHPTLRLGSHNLTDFFFQLHGSAPRSYHLPSLVHAKLPDYLQPLSQCFALKMARMLRSQQHTPCIIISICTIDRHIAHRGYPGPIVRFISLWYGFSFSAQHCSAYSRLGSAPDHKCSMSNSRPIPSIIRVGRTAMTSEPGTDIRQHRWTQMRLSVDYTDWIRLESGCRCGCTAVPI